MISPSARAAASTGGSQAFGAGFAISALIGAFKDALRRSIHRRHSRDAARLAAVCGGLHLTLSLDADMCRAEFRECRFRFSLLKASTESHYLASSLSVEAFYRKKAVKSNSK
jgi:hypothetical protein